MAHLTSLRSSSLSTESIETWLQSGPGPGDYVQLAGAVLSTCAAQNETLLGFEYGFRLLHVALANFPTSLSLVHELASYGSMIDNDQPIPLLTKAWHERRDHISLLILFTQYGINIEKLPREKLFRLMIERDPEWDQAYSLLAAEEMKNGNFEEAIRLYDRALEAHTHSSRTLEDSFRLPPGSSELIQSWKQKAIEAREKSERQ